MPQVTSRWPCEVDSWVLFDDDFKWGLQCLGDLMIISSGKYVHIYNIYIYIYIHSKLSKTLVAS